MRATTKREKNNWPVPPAKNRRKKYIEDDNAIHIIKWIGFNELPEVQATQSATRPEAERKKNSYRSENIFGSDFFVDCFYCQITHKHVFAVLLAFSVPPHKYMYFLIALVFRLFALYVVDGWFNDFKSNNIEYVDDFVCWLVKWRLILTHTHTRNTN